MKIEEKDDLYCQECKQIVVPDPYNPNYLICGCSRIGQVDLCGVDTPLSWESVKTKSYIGEGTKLKAHIMTIIHAVVYVAFGIIMLANIVAITYIYIDYAQGRFEIQKRDAMIQALLLSGKVDAFIVQTHPEEKE